jgi:hypothetical protein
VPEHRRYTKRQKVSAVTAALATSVKAAADSQDIPRKTLSYWMDAPEFATLRQKTREELAEGSIILANLAQSELARKVRAGEVEPRDLAVIYGIAIDKGQLLSGAATHRIETKDLTDGFDDHETRAIVEGARKYLEGSEPAEGEGVAAPAAVEGAAS